MKAYLTPEQRKANRQASFKKWRLSHKRKPLTMAQRLRRNETARLRRAKNLELANAKAKEWCKANPKKVREYVDKWKAKNPNWFPAYYQSRKPKYRASYEKRMSDPQKRAQALEVAN